MGDTQGKRVDSVSRLIQASPREIYQAYMDPEKLVSWLPLEGMKGRIEIFEPREGGSFRMILTYRQPGGSAPGKSSQDSDVVNGRFVELVPDRRIVQEFEFESEDPAFAGTMTMTWQLKPVREGTEVEVSAEDVPTGIGQEDHEEGIGSTLANLAAFVEDRERPEQR